MSVETTKRPMLPRKSHLVSLIVELKRQIGDDYRGSSYQDPGSETTVPTMDVTIGWSGDSRERWAYQTGDNSYSGGAYSYPIWAVVEIDRRSNSLEVADDILDQLANQWWGMQ
jgi:hypothetical protein